MYIPVSPSRRPHALLALLSGIVLILYLHNTHQPRPSFIPNPFWGSPSTSTSGKGGIVGLEEDDYRVRDRIERMRGYCEIDGELEKEYGRTNLRLSRAYEGSHHRFTRFLHKALRGEPLVISVIGGSITKGHHVEKDEIWFHRFWQWLDDYVGEDVQVTEVNGAAPATGSDYFSFCFPLHIPANSDLVLVELAVNDEGILQHVENMENLLRGLLEMPNRPAVMLVEAMAFSSGGMGGGGGRMHLPVAQYYDVPVINQRHPLANHFARYPQLVRPYFTVDGWGNPDTRHFNGRGHRDLGMLIASFVKDVACEMLSEQDFAVPPPDTTDDVSPLLSTIAQTTSDQNQTPEDAQLQDERLAEQQISWPEHSRSWRDNPREDQHVGELMPGMWSTPLEYGLMPRMRILNGWNPDPNFIVPPFHPTCLSTRAKEPQFNLTPSANVGWEHWVHPEHLDKPYMVARTPGATISFEMETNVGVVKMYSLKSKTFGLGTIECWVDGEKDRSVKIVGWWDKGDINIGRFDSIRDNLPPGQHTVTCEVLEETSDPDGGHEFRLISMMR
ncbi:hypothetical protein CI109_100006 [Kwoniella shandongensis]|uniref:SGNH hydrolase-type esterase domain-containing protein n=1 Tax=Kwoniella shandongensis TaxID=1734106 RepID=A0AAJ8LEB7_9TREE